VHSIVVPEALSRIFTLPISAGHDESDPIYSVESKGIEFATGAFFQVPKSCRIEAIVIVALKVAIIKQLALEVLERTFNINESLSLITLERNSSLAWSLALRLKITSFATHGTISIA
jgi:hypothetical protein